MRKGVGEHTMSIMAGGSTGMYCQSCGIRKEKEQEKRKYVVVGFGDFRESFEEGYHLEEEATNE